MLAGPLSISRMNRRLRFSTACFCLLGLACTSTPAFSQTQSTCAKAEPPEVVAGRIEYQGALHSAVAHAQANYIRSLQVTKEQMLRAENHESAAAVEKEIHAVITAAKSTPTALAATTTEKKTKSPTGIPGLEILFVQYRTLDKTKLVDVTSHIREVIASGAQTLHLTTRLGAGGKDPAMVEKKEMVFVYSRDGQNREKAFPEAYQMNFKRDLD
jgi:hypothetical protein